MKTARMPLAAANALECALAIASKKQEQNVELSQKPLKWNNRLLPANNAPIEVTGSLMPESGDFFATVPWF